MATDINSDVVIWLKEIVRLNFFLKNLGIGGLSRDQSDVVLYCPVFIRSEHHPVWSDFWVGFESKNWSELML